MPWTCPFCNSETELGYNVCSECQKPRPGTQSDTAPTATAIPKRQQIDGTGLESILDFAARLLLILGLVALLGSFVATGAVALMIIVCTFLNWLLLRSLAEIIRLLKRISGLDYQGRVSGSYSDLVLSCSICGTVLNSDVACSGCGARLRKPDPEEG